MPSPQLLATDGSGWTTLPDPCTDGGQVLHDLGFTSAEQGFVVEGLLRAGGVPSTRLPITHDAGATWAPVAF